MVVIIVAIRATCEGLSVKARERVHALEPSKSGCIVCCRFSVVFLFLCISLFMLFSLFHVSLLLLLLSTSFSAFLSCLCISSLPRSFRIYCIKPLDQTCQVWPWTHIYIYIYVYIVLLLSLLLLLLLLLGAKKMSSCRRLAQW